MAHSQRLFNRILTIGAAIACAGSFLSAHADEISENPLFGKYIDEQPPPQTAINSSTPQATNNAPSQGNEIELKSSLFYETKWCSLKMPEQTKRFLHFRPDGKVIYSEGTKKTSSNWKAIPSDTGGTRKIVAATEKNAYLMEDDKCSTMMQVGANFEFLSVWYKGEEIPPVSPELSKTICEKNVIFVGEKTTLSFRADGTFQENEQGKMKSGIWKPCGGNEIWVRDLEKGRMFHLYDNYRGMFLCDAAGTILTNCWQKESIPDSTIPAKSPTPQTPPTSPRNNDVTPKTSYVSPKTSNVSSNISQRSEKTTIRKSIAEESEDLKQRFLGEVEVQMKARNETDLRKLESLRKQVGFNDIQLAENIDKAMEAIRAGESIEVEPVNPRASSHLRNFASIATERSRAKNNIALAISQKFRREFDALSKRALAEKNYDLARELSAIAKSKTMLAPSTFPDCLIGKWKSSNGAEFAIRRVGKGARFFWIKGKPINGLFSEEEIKTPEPYELKIREFQIGGLWRGRRAFKLNLSPWGQTATLSPLGWNVSGVFTRE